VSLGQIYRGTFEIELSIGTRKMDLLFLKKIGLIERAFVSESNAIIPFPEGDIWTTTQKGKETVERMLNQ
jgi:hypothetical protein